VGKVIISSSQGIDDKPVVREVKRDELVKPKDSEQFIHIVLDEAGDAVSDRMAGLTCSLSDIGLSVSTGRIVDFRCRAWLRPLPDAGTVPLIHPTHFSNGWVSWPKLGHRKANAFEVNEESEKWLVPAGVYVLTKRFSAKEEKRRLTAAVFDPSRIRCERVAFENHVNYFHNRGHGLTIELSKGLTAFLNSTIVDAYFRQFNGHTQVNASDLRSLRYPSREELEELGAEIGDAFPDQGELDRLVAEGFSKWRKQPNKATRP
jgi:adenine-specific DNA-methyltransferase